MFRFIAGLVVLLIGMVLLVLPGPGILVMLAGLALMGVRMRWLEKLWARMRNRNRPVPGESGESADDARRSTND